ncbi:DUF3095 domain-containing protein [Ruegeria marina]|uniref:DUF3095 domain-containing protein n=1 Tax=Ruegeria marina TaxID=639004 RepID=A0A1G6P8D7_9RHOB|nr:DUF3095 domain-containing protein [Ruegeria marina]SDC76241.1 Protein of unknown function [Ruegeria marina]
MLKTAIPQDPNAFFADLRPVRDFALLADPNRFHPVPDDWVIGTADIVDSTGEIARGRYKTVNMVGAAVISAMVNAMGGRAFPYVFGGDGASFAVAGSDEACARTVLAALRRWAEEEFSISLRAALVPVSAIRAAGRDLRVARYAASDGVDYAMFAGRGLAWAEAQMKNGEFSVEQAQPGAIPVLTGLSCRWSNVRSRNGQILSVVVQPTERATERDFADLARRIVGMTGALLRDGHPLPATGPDVRWPPPGLDLDARVSRAGRSFRLQKFVLLWQNLLIWMLFRTNIRLGGFRPDHYARTAVENADYRKFDDGLKMTLDCDAETRNRLEALLEEARRQGKIRFGLFAQDEAMMTCFVPSAMRDDHVHFVDGAAGGYAAAAGRIK